MHVFVVVYLSYLEYTLNPEVGIIVNGVIVEYRGHTVQ